jgi:peroxiredoxin
MRHIILFILLGVFFASCDEESVKIVFTDVVQPEIEQYIQKQKYVVVIYVDSTECTPCSLNHLSLWKKHQKELTQHETGILLIIHNSDEDAVINVLKDKKIGFNFIFDKGRKFKLKNREAFGLSYDNYDNTFVMDRNKNVVFNGSPITSEEKWKSFIKFLKH